MSNNKVYLLAYPRSGSSFIRYSLGYLSRSKPMQPEGHSELDKYLIDRYENEPFFTKFHYPYDAGRKIIEEPNSTLVLLKRDPVENILSYIFSNEHINRKNFNDDYVKEFINNFLLKNKTLFNEYYLNYKNNINYYNHWEGNKETIIYENFIDDPITEIIKIKDIFKIKQESIDEYINNIDYHRSLILSFKSSTKDPFNINTKGKNKNKFKNLLSKSNLKWFNEILKKDGLIL